MAKGTWKVKMEKEGKKIKGNKKEAKELFSKAAGISADNTLAFIGQQENSYAPCIVTAHNFAFRTFTQLPCFYWPS